MKRFFQKVLKFGIFSFMFLFAINLHLKLIANRNDYYKFQYAEIWEKEFNAKNIIIGTSHATHGIQPNVLKELTGSDFYNFAYNGANFEFYYYWYTQVFRPNYHPPKNIVICIEWFSFDNQWLWRDFEHDAQYWPLATFLNQYFRNDSLDKKKLLGNRYPLLKYGRNIQNFLPNDSTPFIMSGFNKGFIPFELKGNTITEMGKTTSIDSLQIYFFELLIEELKEDNANIIFVSTPEFGLEEGSYLNLSVYSFTWGFSKKLDAPYLNYNTTNRTFINENSSLFSDGGHLNTKGSVEFSKVLGFDINPLLVK